MGPRILMIFHFLRTCWLVIFPLFPFWGFLSFPHDFFNKSLWVLGFVLVFVSLSLYLSIESAFLSMLHMWGSMLLPPQGHVKHQTAGFWSLGLNSWDVVLNSNSSKHHRACLVLVLAALVSAYPFPLCCGNELFNASLFGFWYICNLSL